MGDGGHGPRPPFASTPFYEKALFVKGRRGDRQLMSVPCPFASLLFALWLGWRRQPGACGGPVLVGAANSPTVSASAAQGVDAVTRTGRGLGRACDGALDPDSVLGVRWSSYAPSTGQAAGASSTLSFEAPPEAQKGS